IPGAKEPTPPSLVGALPSRRRVLAACLSLIVAYGCDSSQANVAERVKAKIVKVLDVGADQVIDNARFVQDLGADSLDCVELITAFEEEFGIEIPDEAAEKFLTVGDAVRFIENARPSNERHRSD